MGRDRMLTSKEFLEELERQNCDNVPVERVVHGGHARDVSPNQIINYVNGDDNPPKKGKGEKRNSKSKTQQLKDDAPPTTKFY